MEELDVKEIFNIFWSKKIQIIVIVLAFIIIGIVYTNNFITPMYSSSTTLVLASAKNIETTNSAKAATEMATDITINSKLVSTYSELVKSKNILREVILNTGIQAQEDDLRKNIKVSAVKSTELIEITVQNEEPTVSAKVVNEIAKVFTEKVKEIYNINNVQIVDEAEVSNTPSNINLAKNIVLFAIMGCVIAFAYAVIANMLDTTIKSAEDIEKTYEVPVLASIPMIEKIENERKHGR